MKPTFLILLLHLHLLNGVQIRAPFACSPDQSGLHDFHFCNTHLPIPERVRDLIGQLTLPEKVSLLGDSAKPVPRLGIGGYEWWSEALHGVSNVGPGTKFGGGFPGATSFPQVITLAASFNASLWEDIGTVVSDEARAMYNYKMGGLTYWSPNVNILRDPRWGRGQETPGEDPLLAGKYAASYVKGLQGDREGDRLKVAACCKHFTAYDLDNWDGVDRFHFNAKVTKQDMVDTFDIPFKECVKEGKVASVMCSYNQVNGVPTCADPNLLGKTIRGQWGLDGYIVSDCDSVGVFYDNQHYTSTAEEAAADAIKAGLDLDCGPFLGIHTQEAIKRGLISEFDIDNALKNTLTVQMRLGMFDGPVRAQKYGDLGPSDVCTPAHQELALDAARQGIVLLKNSGPSLPLSRIRHRKVAVIGPNSDVTTTMIGNYAGVACGYLTPLQGLSKYTKTIHYQGCTNVSCEDDTSFKPAIGAASEADATILIMGLDQSIEAEFKDRAHLLLPGHQQELVYKVARTSKGPTILVLMSGGPIDVSFAKNDPRVEAILWVGYPGQAGGQAIADVIYGITNPGGKLPMTWYPQEYLNNVPMTNMAMRASHGYPGRTYRFYKGPVIYPFGHGLTYTHFTQTITDTPNEVVVPLDGHRRSNSSMSSKAVRVNHARCGQLSMVVNIDVRNAGSRDGTHTLLVFSKPPAGAQWANWAPVKQLVAFEKVHVEAGAHKRVRVKIHVCKYLSVVDREGVRRIPLGDHGIHVGDVKHLVSLKPQTLGLIRS